VTLAPGTTLAFALATDGPPPGDLTLEVRAGEALLARESVPARRWNRWTPFAVPVSRAGTVSLSFAGTFAGGSAAAAPAILLGSPRLERSPIGRAPKVVLWISQDALAADHLSAYGYARKTSPGLERLAPSLVLFEDAVAPATWTLPSLASQFTSRYPPFHGAVLEDSARDPRTTTVFEALRAAGFTTIGVTGNRYVGPDFGMAQGFDVLYYSPGHADEIVRTFEEARREWAGGDVAFFVHFMDTHFPYEPPPPFATAFDRDYRGAIDGRSFFERRKELKERDVEHVRALYDSSILFADAQIAALLEAFPARDSAYFLYTADHGEGFLEHGRFLHAGTVYRELTHVPFAARFPGVLPRRVPDTVSLVDIAPTVLDALGVERPRSFQGRSLLPLLEGRSMDEVPALSETRVTNNNAFWKVAVEDPSESLLVKVRRDADPEEPFVSEELFDRRKDPYQKAPLPPSPAAEGLRKRIRAYLASARSAGVPAGKADVPEAVKERLRALGYLKP
jgi:arylsulfatase A-like enzyme